MFEAPSSTVLKAKKAFDRIGKASPQPEITMKITGQSSHCESSGYLMDRELIHLRGSVSGFSSPQWEKMVIVEFRNDTGKFWQKLCSFPLEPPTKDQIRKAMMGCYCTAYNETLANFYVNLTAKSYNAMRAVMNNTDGSRNVSSAIVQIPRAYAQPVMVASFDGNAIKPYGNCSLVVEEAREYSVHSCYVNLNQPTTSISIHGHHVVPGNDPCLTMTLTFTSDMSALDFHYQDKCKRSNVYICKLIVVSKLSRLFTKYLPWLLPAVTSTIAVPATIYILYYFKIIFCSDADVKTEENTATNTEHTFTTTSTTALADSTILSSI
nr:hypothetical protein BgiMline_030916 [Biomphalaria glabrata]